MIRLKYLTITLVTLLSVGSFSCDTGLGLLETKITGRVVFINSDKKPDLVESVWVVAAAKSLFNNPTLNDLVISDRPVNLNKDSSEYEVFVPPGSYVIVAAIWKQKGKDWNFLNIIGRYGYDPVHFTYFDTQPVVISDRQKVVSGKDIICDWSFVFTGSGNNARESLFPSNVNH